MTNLIRSFNGRTIRQREDGYLSATDMCKATGRLFADYTRLKTTDEYLEALSTIMGIPIMVLVESNVGGSLETTGSWVHRKIALHLAQWLSPEFYVQCNEWVEELLLKGTVSINETAVNPKDVFMLEAIKAGIEIAKYNNDDRAMIVYGSQLQNLITRQTVLPQQQNLLPEEVWLTVSEVLEREGYSLSGKDLQNSLGQVGKLVKASYLIDTGNEPKIIEKAVGTNHRPTKIKLYPEDYFGKIVEVACDYWSKKEIGI